MVSPEYLFDQIYTASNITQVFLRNCCIVANGKFVLFAITVSPDISSNNMSLLCSEPKIRLKAKSVLGLRNRMTAYIYLYYNIY